VRAHGGLPLHALNAFLDARGLALANLGAISLQTVAGALATGTHGTGPTTALSGFVTALELVLPNGTAVNCSRGAHAALFSAARAGYGALGAVVWAELAVVPAWRQERVWAPWGGLDALLAALPALRRDFDQVNWGWTPYNDSSAVALVKARLPPGAPLSGCWNGGRNYTPPLTPPPTGLAWPPGTYACSDAAFRTLTWEGEYPGPRYTEMELMVAEADAGALVADVRALLARLAPAAAPLWAGVRYVRADDVPLSPFFARDSAVLSLIVFGGAGAPADAGAVRALHGGAEALAAARYAARPHPGKNNYFTAEMMAAAYPETHAAFVRLRAEVDPTGRLDNEYLGRLFPRG